MKKTVILLIAIIYVASITLVTFFGLQYVDHQTELIPVTTVEIVNEGILYDEAGEKYISLFVAPDGSRTFQIEYKVTPDNATNADVDFIIEENTIATVDENGLVTFTEPGAVLVRITSTDGTRCIDSVLVNFMN